MENSRIEWTDHTFNPWIGCTKVSTGCANCYAERENARHKWVRWGKGVARRRTSEGYWKKPHKWDDLATANGVRYKVFCASLADVFDDEVPDQWRNELWGLMTFCDRLDWLVLTKRPENIVGLVPMEWLTENGWPYNIWLGTSVEDKETAMERIPRLRGIPAKVKFLSVEPLLAPIDFSKWPEGLDFYVNWVIVGGESGPNARPLHPDWVANIRDACIEKDIPFFFKQWGQYSYHAGGYGSSIKPDGEIVDGPSSASAKAVRHEKALFFSKANKRITGRKLEGKIWSQFPK